MNESDRFWFCHANDANVTITSRVNDTTTSNCLVSGTAISQFVCPGPEHRSLFFRAKRPDGLLFLGLGIFFTALGFLTLLPSRRRLLLLLFLLLLQLLSLDSLDLSYVQSFLARFYLHCCFLTLKELQTKPPLFFLSTALLATSIVQLYLFLELSCRPGLLTLPIFGAACGPRSRNKWNQRNGNRPYQRQRPMLVE